MVDLPPVNRRCIWLFYRPILLGVILEKYGFKISLIKPSEVDFTLILRYMTLIDYAKI